MTILITILFSWIIAGIIILTGVLWPKFSDYIREEFEDFGYRAIWTITKDILWWPGFVKRVMEDEE